jgi:hypothetical protein
VHPSLFLLEKETKTKAIAFAGRREAMASQRSLRPIQKENFSDLLFVFFWVRNTFLRKKRVA